MKQRLILVLISSLLVFIAFFTVMVGVDSPEQAITTPKQSGEGVAIEKAFRKAVGTNGIQLQYPTEGDYKSAFVTKNLDDDEEEEALVFYSNDTADTNVHIRVLDKQDGKWTSISDIKGYGNKIDSISFDDLNGDSIPELVTSWSLYDSNSSRILTVQSSTASSKEPLTTIANQSYSYMGLADMDNDGVDEILVIWNETKDKLQKTYASLLKMENETITQLGDNAKLDANAAVYSSFKVQHTGNQPVAFIDAMKADNSMITEVLSYNRSSGRLEAPFTANPSITNTKTLRTPAIPSMDIDGDGVIEIPVPYGNAIQDSSVPQTVVGTGTETPENDEERLFLTSWYNVTSPFTGAMSEKSYAFVNADYKRMIKVTNGYRQNLMAYRNKKNGRVTVYSSSGGITRGRPLFTVTFTRNMKGEETYTYKKQLGDVIAYGTLTEEGKNAGFTNEKIAQLLTYYR